MKASCRRPRPLCGHAPKGLRRTHAARVQRPRERHLGTPREFPECLPHRDGLRARAGQLGNGDIPTQCRDNFSRSCELLHAPQHIPRILEFKEPKMFLGEIFWKRAILRAMEATRADSKEAVAARLRLLRQVVAGGNQTAFAARLGIEVKRWNNFERGSPLSKEVAILIVQKFPDITLDWLFLGRSDGLTVKRQRELEQAGNSGITPAGRPSSSRGG